MSFVHSRVHSNYSVGRGASDLKALFKRAAALGQPAIALTDDAALHGAYKIGKYSQEFGVQPIVGAKLYMPCGKDYKSRGSFLVYAQSETGYANVCRMLKSVLDPERKEKVGTLDGPTLRNMKASTKGNDSWTRDVVVAMGIGGDALCGKLMADIGKDRTIMLLEHVFGMFPASFLEVCRTGYETAEEVAREAELVDWAIDKGVPLLATTPVWYADPSRHDAWTIMNAVADGGTDLLQGGKGGLEHANPYRAHLRDRAEMEALFPDLPAALDNTLALAQVAPYWPTKRKPMLPRFESGTGLSEAQELRKRSNEGLAARLDAMAADDDTRRAYAERLDFELGVIERMKFPGYFLIVSDFIKWAKSQDIPVGPGRGSGAGSLVAYALVITDVDPIPFGLLFERFLNPDRVSMPDFDIDFCEDRREEVIRYVQQRYGKDRVARIQTFTEYRPKSALKDVGRIVAHHDSGKLSQNRLNQLTALFPKPQQGKEAKMDEVVLVEAVAEAIASDPRVALAFDKANDVQGMLKTSSTHAAGIVIGSDSLDRQIPVGFDEHGNLAVQFDMKDTEEVGLVKFDFLGLTTLTIIQWAIRHVADLEGVRVDFTSMGFDDPATLELFAAGRTTGVFQFESEGMKKALAKVKSDRIEDLIAVNALYRPGPMEMIPVYAECKHGLRKPEYPEPRVRTEPYLRETYGVMVYQEQIIQIAQSVAGMSLGKADLLRRAIGKKNKEEMAQQKVIFIEGAVRNGATERQARDLFALIEKFADYGFNKSHAAAYSVVAYQTAYLKAHHPASFFSASLCYPKKKEDRGNLRRDMDLFGVPMLPPDINMSVARFVPERDDQGRLAVRFGLMAVDKTTALVIDKIVERRQAGPFRDLIDFHERAGGILNAAQTQHLAALGTFDSINPGGNRRQAFEILQFLSKNKVKDTGSLDMFGGAARIVVKKEILATTEWPDLAKRCREAADFHIVSHPLDAFVSELTQMGVKLRGDFESEFFSVLEATKRFDHAPQGYLHCMVDDFSVENSSRGQYVRLRASDREGSYSVNMYPNVKGSGKFEAELKLIIDTAKMAKKENKPVVVKMKTSYNGDRNKLYFNGSEMMYADTFLDSGMEPMTYKVYLDTAKCIIANSMGFEEKSLEINSKVQDGVAFEQGMAELMQFYSDVVKGSFDYFEDKLREAIDKKEIKSANEDDSSIIEMNFELDVTGKKYTLRTKPFQVRFKGGHFVYSLLQSLSGVHTVSMDRRYVEGRPVGGRGQRGWSAPAGPPTHRPGRQPNVLPFRRGADQDEDEGQGGGAPPMGWRKRGSAPAAPAAAPEHRDEEPAPFSLH